jgi:hypothetical protein
MAANQKRARKADDNDEGANPDADDMQNLMTMIQILMMMEIQMIVLNYLAHS